MSNGRINKEKMNLAMAKKRQRKTNIRNKTVAFFTVLVLLLIAGWLVFDKLFVISGFSINGTYEYSSEDAKDFAKRIGLEEGMHMFGFSRDELSQKAKYYIPEVDSVSIDYKLPDKIVFNVKEAIPAMYLTENSRHYILSEALKVVKTTENAEDAEVQSLIKVQIGDITKCQSGTFVETQTGCDKTLISLYKVMKEEEIAEEVSEIDLRNKFDISFEYKQRFSVKLGNSENFTVKIRFMKRIVDELSENDRGYIDVSDENFREGTFKPYS